MMNPAQSAELRIGDRVRLVRGLLRGQTARITGVNNDGSYFLIGDWTRYTGFVSVHCGPVDRDRLEKLESA
jgi:transcription antitermination factor NusG